MNAHLEISIETRLKQDLSMLLDTVSFIKQNDDCSKEEQEIIDHQLLKLQDDIKNVLVDTQLYTKIKEFINAIKGHNNSVKYFDNIKDDKNPALYQELIYNFNEGMIAQPLLYKYFNLVYNFDTFEDNKLFLKILKDKDDMFMADPNENPRYNRKKRYKIVEKKAKTRRHIGGLKLVNKKTGKEY